TTTVGTGGTTNTGTTSTAVTTTSTAGVGGGTGWCCDCGQTHTVCLTFGDAPCPSSAEAESYMGQTCIADCMDLAWVEGGPYPQNGQCCYDVVVGCVGRPLVIERAA